MVALIGQFIEQAFIGLCFFALAQLLLGLAALVRLLPLLLRFLRASLRWFLMVSFRLYHLVLTRLAPTVGEYVGVNILSGWGRVITCLTLSVAIGLLLLLLLQHPITILGVGLIVTHGLVVGLMWHDLEPSGIRIGEKIE